VETFESFIVFGTKRGGVRFVSALTVIPLLLLPIPALGPQMVRRPVSSPVDATLGMILNKKPFIINGEYSISKFFLYFYYITA